jgi:hypothetical protein
MPADAKHASAATRILRVRFNQTNGYEQGGHLTVMPSCIRSAAKQGGDTYGKQNAPAGGSTQKLSCLHKEALSLGIFIRVHRRCVKDLTMLCDPWFVERMPETLPAVFRKLFIISRR